MKGMRFLGDRLHRLADRIDQKKSEKESANRPQTSWEAEKRRILGAIRDQLAEVVKKENQERSGGILKKKPVKLILDKDYLKIITRSAYSDSEHAVAKLSVRSTGGTVGSPTGHEVVEHDHTFGQLPFKGTQEEVMETIKEIVSWRLLDHRMNTLGADR